MTARKSASKQTTRTSASKQTSQMLVERSVFLEAQDQFLIWLADPHFGGRQIDLDVDELTEINRAASRLLKALKALSPAPADEKESLIRLRRQEQRLRAVLVGSLQENQAYKPIDEYLQELDEFEQFLLDLQDAAAKGSERSAKASCLYFWVRCAAEQWHATFGDDPSTSLRGRFWQALQDFQGDESARSKDVPQVKSHDTAKRAIQSWMEVKGFRRWEHDDPVSETAPMHHTMCMCEACASRYGPKVGGVQR